MNAAFETGLAARFPIGQDVKTEPHAETARNNLATVEIAQFAIPRRIADPEQLAVALDPRQPVACRIRPAPASKIARKRKRRCAGLAVSPPAAMRLHGASTSPMPAGPAPIICNSCCFPSQGLFHSAAPLLKTARTGEGSVNDAAISRSPLERRSDASG